MQSVFSDGSTAVATAELDSGDVDSSATAVERQSDLTPKLERTCDSSGVCDGCDGFHVTEVAFGVYQWKIARQTVFLWRSDHESVQFVALSP
jgi:hypothetical protein